MRMTKDRHNRRAWTAYVESGAGNTWSIDTPSRVTSIDFTVDTKGIPQGSMSGICTEDAAGNPITVLKADNPRTHGFRNLVGFAALQARAAAGIHGVFAPTAVPIRVSITFVFKKPKSAAARRYHTVKPDLDKLARACNDAMTGVLYADDAQIVSDEHHKIYGEPERVQISVQLV